MHQFGSQNQGHRTRLVHADDSRFVGVERVEDDIQVGHRVLQLYPKLESDYLRQLFFVCARLVGQNRHMCDIVWTSYYGRATSRTYHSRSVEISSAEGGDECLPRLICVSIARYRASASKRHLL